MTIQWETKSIPRLRDNLINKRLVFVSERPPVCSNTARRLAEDSDFVRIAAETGDALVHPFDGLSLVAEA